MGENLEGDTDFFAGGEREDVLAALTDLVMKLDPDGTIQQVHPGDTPTLGHSPGSLCGEHVTHLFAGSVSTLAAFDVTTAGGFETALLDTETSGLTAPFETADGSVRSMSVSVVGRDAQPGSLCVARETKQTPAGDGLDESQTGLMDAVGDPTFVLDESGAFERVNRALLEQTGYERTELLGRVVSEILPAGVSAQITETLASLPNRDNAEAALFEMPLVTTDGTVILTEANVAVLRDETGAYVGAVGVLRDIRERKHRERDLELLKQVLTRVFRHNVRNELMIVQGHAELIEEEADEQSRAHASQILETADRLLAHSEKARRIEKVIETKELREIDLTETVRDLAAAAREQYPDASIQVEVGTDSSVQAHPDISKAIEELIKNAVEHAPASAEAWLKVWVDEQAETTTLFIEDESGGFAENELNVLRKRAENKLEHSSGVGLWLVRWLVEYSDAEMIVHQTDKGSLMGIQFSRRATALDERGDALGDSPLARAPAHVQDISPERFRGDSVIGRMDALHTLEDIYENIDHSGGHAVVITGEAGIGKTTLVEQFRDEITQTADPPVVATGFCDEGLQPPYHAFRQVIADLPTESELSELLADVASLPADDRETVRQRKQALFADVADLLRDVATDNPVVLVVEDMQWADQGTIDLFEYLVDEVGRWGHPVMFVGTYRTSDVDRTHPVLAVAEETAKTGRGTVIPLEPFDEDEVETLLSYMLEVDQIPASFVEAVHDHTGGTPLFVNELGRHLAETLGPIQTHADLPETLDSVSIPDTVESVVAQRLDALPDRVWPVLRVGAIIGREFSFDVVRTASDYPVERLIECIDTLVDRHVWTRSGGTIEFVHGVVREQALATIDDDHQERLNTRAAHAIETVHENEIDEYAGRIARHYEQVGAYDTAFEYYRAAGEHAEQTYAHHDAVDNYERAISLAQTHDLVDDQTLATLHATLADACRTIGDVDVARKRVREGLTFAPEQSIAACRLLGVQARAQLSQSEFEAARETAQKQRELAASLGVARLEAAALYSLGEVARHQSEYETAREYHERGLALAQETGDRESEARTRNCLGDIARRQGDHESARRQYELGFALAQEVGDRQVEARGLLNLGIINRIQGDYDQAREYYERSLEIKREIGDRKGEASSLMSLGIIADKRGNHSDACEYYEQSLHIYREIGDRMLEAHCLINFGTAVRDQGEYTQAREYFKQSLTICQAIGSDGVESVCLLNLGIIARLRGAVGLAREYLEQSLHISREIGDSEGEAWCLANLGFISLGHGDHHRARQHLTEAVDIARDIGVPEPETTSLRGLAALAREAGDYDQAAQYIEDSLSACDETNQPRRRAKTRLEQARLALARGDTDEAGERAKTVRERFAGLGVSHYEGRAIALQAQTAASEGEWAATRDHWEAALERFEMVDAPGDALDALDSLVELCRRAGKTDQAAEWRDRAESILPTAPEAVADTHRDWIDARFDSPPE